MYFYIIMYIVRYRHRLKSLLNINKYRFSLKTQLLMRIKKKGIRISTKLHKLTGFGTRGKDVPNVF